MTRRARSGRGWDAAPPRAPRTRRPSPEDGPATPTTPDDDLWAADPATSTTPSARRRKPASEPGSDRPARTGLFRASDLRPASDPDTASDRRPAPDPDTGSDLRPASDQRPAAPRALPWSLDDMRRTGNQPTGTGPAGRDGEPSTRRAAPRGRRRAAADTPGEKKPAAPRDPGEHAREICLRLLSVRPRTRSELAAALVKRGIPDEVVAEVLDRYDEVGIIDDAAFARSWVESRHHGKGLARRALRQELRRKGVEQDVIADALLEIEPETEEVTARELVERKLRTTRGDPDAVFRRLVGMLARKGYPPGVAVRAVKDVLEQKGFEQDFSEQAGADWADALESEAVQAEGERPDRV